MQHTVCPQCFNTMSLILQLSEQPAPSDAATAAAEYDMDSVVALLDKQLDELKEKLAMLRVGKPARTQFDEG